MPQLAVCGTSIKNATEASASALVPFRPSTSRAPGMKLPYSLIGLREFGDRWFAFRDNSQSLQAAAAHAGYGIAASALSSRS